MCLGCCPELENPPSRSNMSICAIIELIVMGVVGIMCFVDLFNILNSGAKLNDVWIILSLVIDVLIVVGLILVLTSLFCARSLGSLRSGILCFLVGAIISVVVTIYYIVGSDSKINVSTLCYIILLIFLVYVLWVQSSHL